MLVYKVQVAIMFCINLMLCLNRLDCYSMPRKFRRYVPKGASRKSSKNVTQSSTELEKVELGEQPSITTANATTPSLHGSSHAVATQTDFTSCSVVTRENSTQTDDMDMPDEELIDDSASLNHENLCEGNNDAKFHSLVIKHKGVFTNVKGT